MSRSLYRGWKPLLLLLRRSRTGSGSLLHRGWIAPASRLEAAPTPLLHRSWIGSCDGAVVCSHAGAGESFLLDPAWWDWIWRAKATG